MLVTTKPLTTMGIGPQVVATSMLDLIGNTPVLELDRVRTHMGLSGRLLAELELMDSGGSKKEWVALSMIRVARRSGQLADGQAVVEVTSGNTGRGWRSYALRWVIHFTRS